MRELVVVVAVAGCGDPHAAHCLTLCTGSATVTAATALAPAAIVDATVTVCVNPTVCSSAPLTTARVDATGDFAAEITTTTDANGRVTLTIDVLDDRDSWFRDGDVWIVTITDPGGVVIYTARAAATYTSSAPDCEGHICRTLDLQL